MKPLTKRQIRQALIEAAKELDYETGSDRFSCNAVEYSFRRKTGSRVFGKGMARFYRDYTCAHIIDISSENQLARQLAVLMFMEATT